MTNKVVDVTTGTSTKIQQDLDLTMSKTDADMMASDDSYNIIIIKGIVAGLCAASTSTCVYLDEYFTIISKTVVEKTRRLDGRQLAAHDTHELKVKYEALLPSTAPAITKDSIDKTAFVNTVNQESAAANKPVTVASVTASEPVDLG